MTKRGGSWAASRQWEQGRRYPTPGPMSPRPAASWSLPSTGPKVLVGPAKAQPGFRDVATSNVVHWHRSGDRRIDAAPQDVRGAAVFRRDAVRVTPNYTAEVKRRAERPTPRERKARWSGEVVPAMVARSTTTTVERDDVRQEVLDLVRPGAECRRQNRPTSNRGDGSGRPFIPWCEKGKK